MNLPTTRNTTYGANTPIKSADINALQDLFVGDKHTSREQLIGPAGFQVMTGAVATVCGDQWTGTTVNVGAGLDFLKVGDRITQITFQYLVGAGGGTVTWRLRRRDMTAGGAPPAAVTLAAGSDNTNAGVLELGVLAAINHTVVSGWQYSIDITGANNNTQIYGASVVQDCL